MSDIGEQVSEATERGRESRFNSVVALFVVITATLLALGKIKDDNIVQAMQQDQVHSVDAWSYYQAKGIKENLALTRADNLRLQVLVAGPALAADLQARLGEQIKAAEAESHRYAQEKENIRAQAEALQQDYARLGRVDDQFDLSDAGFSIAMALFGIAALTRRRSLLLAAQLPFGFGLLMLVAGFSGWDLHPDALVALLS